MNSCFFLYIRAVGAARRGDVGRAHANRGTGGRDESGRLLIVTHFEELFKVFLGEFGALVVGDERVRDDFRRVQPHEDDVRFHRRHLSRSRAERLHRRFVRRHRVIV